MFHELAARYYKLLLKEMIIYHDVGVHRENTNRLINFYYFPKMIVEFQKILGNITRNK